MYHAVESIFFYIQMIRRVFQESGNALPPYSFSFGSGMSTLSALKVTCTPKHQVSPQLL